MYEKVLVPLDYSPVTEHVLSAAKALATYLTNRPAPAVR
jgi:hypothetical protein